MRGHRENIKKPGIARFFITIFHGLYFPSLILVGIDEQVVVIKEAQIFSPCGNEVVVGPHPPFITEKIYIVYVAFVASAIVECQKIGSACVVVF